jgi:hypothetical protein
MLILPIDKEAARSQLMMVGNGAFGLKAASAVFRFEGWRSSAIPFQSIGPDLSV